MLAADKRYDVFISYAHKDNPKPECPITKLVDLLKEIYRSHYDGEEIAVFFDEDGIKPSELWENKILESLRLSSVMIVILSSDYYNSKYCHKEWQYFQDVEIHYSLPGAGIIPSKYREHTPNKEHNTSDVNVWIQDLEKRQYFDISDWKTNRNTEAFIKRLLAVCEQIHDRKRRLESRRQIRTNVRPHNPNFTGRYNDIKQIHNALVNEKSIGVITAIKGIGGIGKSMIAFEYAHAHIDDYPGGTFVFNAEGENDFHKALASIAVTKGIIFKEAERENLDFQCNTVWQNISQGQPALLILDNVDKEKILERAVILEHAPDRHKLHILVTSRKGFSSGDDIKEISISPLEYSLSLESQSLSLLLKYFPAKDNDELKAANEITLRLGGHPLALTMVGTFLKFKKTMSFTVQLNWLKDKGIGALDQIGKEGKIRLDYANPVPSQIFMQIFNELSDLEKRILQYAALLPPDSIPLPWIYELLKDEYPEIVSNPDTPYFEPWNDCLQKLDQFQLLLPFVNEPKIGNMHRLTQEVIRQSHERNNEYAERFINHLSYVQLFLHECSKQYNFPDDCFWIIKLKSFRELLVFMDTSQWKSKIDSFEKIVHECSPIMLYLYEIKNEYPLTEEQEIMYFKKMKKGENIIRDEIKNKKIKNGKELEFSEKFIQIAKKINRYKKESECYKKKLEQLGTELGEPIEDINQMVKEIKRGRKILKTAKDKLIYANLLLVVSIAKKYSDSGQHFFDIVQEGNIGLIRAIEKYRYRKCSKFSLYITNCIEKAISNSISPEPKVQEKAPTIKILERLDSWLSTIPVLEQDIIKALFGDGEIPTIEEVISRFNVTQEQINQIVDMALRHLKFEKRNSRLKDFLEQ